ncbi:MAG: pyridoxal-phosphate dependent enzyme [Chlorobia bacterium]|nr:pyridoxal-phosphate dependent enzyme [Fimbriimonadaceae bacterium]
MHRPKISLIQAPTPLHRLDRASVDMGIDLWIKRDDLTGFAMGGNKGRKLEYIMGEALAQGAEAAVTCGATQSNFIRQLGVAAAVCGVQCAAAAMQTPCEFNPPLTDGLTRDGGNVALGEWVGIDLHVYPDGTWDELNAHAEDLAQMYERRGLRVYRIPVGGSSPTGAYAFWEAGREVGPDFDCIVFASSSGSTQVGLAHAFRDTKTKVLGVASDPEPEIVEDFAELSRGLAALMGGEPVDTNEFRVFQDMVGPGYGIPSKEGNDAIRYLARKEGIFLDPIYSGKAFAGLLELVKRGEIEGRVCFWHTGGLPNLFAMRSMV